MSKLITLKEACELLNISAKTIYKYGTNGTLKEYRTAGGHRRYRLDEVEALIGIQPKEKSSETKACCYCRVSSNDQKKHGDLDRQKLRLLEYCSANGYRVDHILVEVCSGMKDKRPKLDKLYELVETKQIDVVIVEHKDRLARFMFGVFERFFASHGVKIVFAEQDLPKSFETELVADIMSLMTSFTATLHSRRKRQSKEYRKRLEQEGIVV